MSTTDLPILGKISAMDVLTVSFRILVLSILYIVAARLYDIYYGPLSKYPGPKLYAFSRLPRIFSMASGKDSTDMPALHQKYGPIVRISPQELSYAGGTQAWKDIYGFKKHGQPSFDKYSRFYTLPLNGVPSPIQADDANHSRQRKILSHAFSDKGLKEQEPMLKFWAGKFKDKLVERAGQNQKTDVLAYYNFTTFDIMGDLTFGEGLNMLDGSEYTPWVTAIFLGMKNATQFRAFKYYGLLPTLLVEKVLFMVPKVREKAFEHWNYTTERVDKRLKRTPERPDLWTKILEKSEDDGGLTVDEHHSVGALFMLAGTETTATALSGVTYHLLRNPACLATLAKEIRGEFDIFDDLNLEALARLKYLHAILQEGLRMYPPVPIGAPRKTPKGGAAVCGEWVPGNTVVSVHQMSTYRNEENFRKANEFHPERWLGDPEFEADDREALEPFTIGPRNCLGKNLAWHEMRLLLATVILHFDLELCAESMDWSDQKVYTLWEKKPLMCTLRHAKS